MARATVSQQPGFILHRRLYRESSMLVEVFTRHHGRITLIAKGARKNRKQSQGLFLPFKPALLGWTGKGELPILTGIEQSRHVSNPDPMQIKCGLYMNELILKLLYRYDPHEVLYDQYEQAVGELLDSQDASGILRVFEKNVLQETGFGLVLDHDAETGEAIRKEARYRYVPGKGPVSIQPDAENLISGSTLVALNNEERLSDTQNKEARMLTRSMIDLQLNGKSMRTRRVAREMTQYQRKFCQ